VFFQIQRLQRPKHPVFVDGVDLEKHATIVQPEFKGPEFEVQDVAR
jgi:hypothetical protein